MRENPQFFAKLKELFSELETPQRIEEIMSVVVEKMAKAQRDGESHNRHLHLMDPPLVISISVWPHCSLQELAERFQQETGAPYMEASWLYVAEAGRTGAQAFIHLFFCYNDEEAGAAIALLPCDNALGRQTGILLPESIRLLFMIKVPDALWRKFDRCLDAGGVPGGRAPARSAGPTCWPGISVRCPARRWNLPGIGRAAAVC